VERELIERVLAGDRAAMDALVDRYWAFMRAVVMRVAAGRVSVIEEVPQIVVMRLLENDFRLLRRWRGDGPFSSYLARIVRTTAADYFRDRHGLPVDPFPDDTWEPVDPHPIAPSDFAEEERRRMLRGLLAGLRPADRALLERKFWDDCPNDQIARDLGIELNALHQRLHRALRRLHRLAAERCPGMFPDPARRGPGSPASPVRPGQPAASGE